MIDDIKLMQWITKPSVSLFCEMARMIEHSTIFGAISDLLEHGNTADQIAEKFDLNPTDLRIVLKRMRRLESITLTERTRRISQLRIDLPEVRASGMSAPEIAKAYCCSQATVTRLLRELPGGDPISRAELISQAKATKYGLRLRDGTRLIDHCAAMGLKPRMQAYDNERNRLAREGRLITAEEYRRAEEFRLQSETAVARGCSPG